MTLNESTLFMDIHKLCRICLTENQNMKSLFSQVDDEELIQFELLTLSEVLSQLTSLSFAPNDGFPTLTCANCVLLIYNAYKFKVQFNHSNSILQQYVAENLKHQQNREASNIIINFPSDALTNYRIYEAKAFDENVCDDFIDSILQLQKSASKENHNSPQAIAQDEHSTVAQLQQQKSVALKECHAKLQIITKTEEPAYSTTQLQNITSKQNHSKPQKVTKVESSVTVQMQNNALKENDSKKQEVVKNDKSNTVSQLQTSISVTNYSELQLIINDDSNTTTIENRKTKKIIKKRRSKLTFCSDENKIDNQTEENTVSSSSVNKLFPCPICTKEFSALNLRKHIQSHKALRKYLGIPEKEKVKTSRARFYKILDPDNLSTDLYNHSIKLHNCVYCNSEFDAHTLRLHMQEHKNQIDFKCDQCGRVFNKVNHLNTHRIKHLKEYPFNCRQCGKGFVIKKNYDCHMLSHNTSEELPHECRYCLKRFYNPEHLNRHIIVHTENVTYSDKYKVCRCHKCRRTFKDSTELQNHICNPLPVKMNSARFYCRMCNKSFNNCNTLKIHNREIHKQTTTKLCSVCGAYVSNIYSHMMRHTGEKPFQCNQCGKRFFSKPQLRQHLLVHSGLKPYVCSVCAKAFNNLYNLQVHERIHKGDRCHICSVCSKGFLEKSYLKKHMNIHNKV